MTIYGNYMRTAWTGVALSSMRPVPDGNRVVEHHIQWFKQTALHFDYASVNLH